MLCKISLNLKYSLRDTINMKQTFLALVFLVACSACNKETHAPAPLPNFTLNVVGTWKVTSITNLVPSQPMPDSILHLIIDSMILVGKVQFKPDSTYIDTTFEGVETGRWLADSATKYIYKMRGQRGTDTMKVINYSYSKMQGHLNTSYGSTADFIVTRKN